MQRNRYEVWQRYGNEHRIGDLVLELTDLEVKLLMDCFSDPIELRREDGTDISYIWEKE